MIYLIEGVLPEGYFANNLRGLSVDMAVFRDLLRVRLQNLSRHLDKLQTESKDSGRTNILCRSLLAVLANAFYVHRVSYVVLCVCVSSNRDQLRAAADERVHNAMVSYVVLQLSSTAHGAPGLGPDFPGGEHGAPKNRPGHLGRVVRVSMTRRAHVVPCGISRGAV